MINPNCKKSVRIFLDVPRWFYSTRSTDWLLKIQFANEMRDHDVSISSNIIYDFIYNLQYVACRFLPRRFMRGIMEACSRLRGIMVSRTKVAVVVSQGVVPVLSPGKKTIWETYFLPPQIGEQGVGEFSRGGNNPWIISMEKYGSKVYRIGVRGTFSVMLLRKMYPEYADKVLDLGFVHSEYACLSDIDIEGKQSHQQKDIEILFVGRMAKLKGLDILIKALEILRKERMQGFRFTIISNFHDGHVQLPKEAWVNWLGEVEHDEVLDAFKRANLFVMPSFRDSYGLVYHEALANGCVTFVPDREPQKEFVDYGRAGMIINPLSPEDIAAKIKMVLDDHKLRTRLAIAGKNWYLERFSQRVVREAWQGALFEEA